MLSAGRHMYISQVAWSHMSKPCMLLCLARLSAECVTVMGTNLHHQFLHDTVTCLLMLYGHMVRPGCVLACINKPQWDHAQT